ncbi:MAG: MFS transporter [Tumebacillaceae bacterium]
MLSIRALRMYNYFYFSLLSIFISFLPVYLTSRGMSMAETGMMIGTGSFIGILSQPFWGYQSDKYRTVKKVLLLTLSLATVTGAVLFSAKEFAYLFPLVGLMYFFFLPSDPLTENLNVRLSERMGVSFGAVRMFGAIGYASTSLIVGLLSDWFGLGSFAWMFAGYGVIVLLILSRLPDVTTQPKSISVKDLWKFLTYRKTVLFFTLVLITAIPHRMNDNFLGVYVQSLGGSTAMVGLAWFVAAVSEIVFFAWSARFVRSGNEVMLISAAAVLYAVRYLLTSMLTTPLGVVGLQLLQGVTFVVFYTASISYLNRIVPEEWRATGMTLLAVLFFGVSGIVGSFFGGWVFEQFGGSTLYLVMAALSGCGFLFSIIMRKERKGTPDE